MTADRSDKHSLLDMDIILSRQEIGDDFFALLLDTFSHEVPDLLKKMNLSVKKGDRNAIIQHCHKLKGMSINVGALSLSRFSQEIEETFYQEEFSVLGIAVEKLEQIYLQSMKELENFRIKKTKT